MGLSLRTLRGEKLLLLCYKCRTAEGEGVELGGLWEVAACLRGKARDELEE